MKECNFKCSNDNIYKNGTLSNTVSRTKSKTIHNKMHNNASNRIPIYIDRDRDSTSDDADDDSVKTIPIMRFNFDKDVEEFKNLIKQLMTTSFNIKISNLKLSFLSFLFKYYQW